MKYVRQLLIILFVSFFGELLKYIIPLSIPASIYGMVLLFLALELKILKVSDIKETSNFLIEIMPLMFVPGVGLLDSWGSSAANLDTGGCHYADLNGDRHGSFRKHHAVCDTKRKEKGGVRT